GNLLLTCTMLWAYLTLSQFLIQWTGNLPEEIVYYKTRTAPVWSEIGTLIVVGSFFLPFLLLLSGRTKRLPTLLQKVAAWIFFIRMVDIYWTIIPFFVPMREAEHLGATPYVVDIVAFLAMGAVWLVLYSMWVKQWPLLPAHEPRMQEA